MDIYNLLESRPTPLRKWDQFLATPETTLKRAALICEFLGYHHQKVAFLGDDDGTSVALAALDRNLEITVFEIDKRILNWITEADKALGLRVRSLPQDLRDPLPARELKKYALVFSDPPYTPEGATLFMGRGITLLDPKDPCPSLFLCYGYSPKARERALPFQEMIAESRLLIRQVWPDFNNYAGAAAIGNTSSLYHLVYTPRTRLPVNFQYPKKVYTHEP